jgi:hypothetical protein
VKLKHERNEDFFAAAQKPRGKKNKKQQQPQ